MKDRRRFRWAHPYLWVSTSAGLAGLVLAGACSIYNESLLEPKSSGEGGSGEGAAGSTGPAGLGGSAGAPCATVDQCPGMDGPCQTRACNAGFCSVQNVAAGTKVGRQKPADCQEVQCDGMGAVTTVAADADVEDDKKECTADGCANGLPTHTPKPTGSNCTQNGGKKCSVDSVCVECVVDNDCASKVCDDMFKCAPAMCGDTVKNGAETDTDCGGSMCPPCATGKKCVMATDCISGVCTATTCAPSCTDMLQNQGETDVDCGGPCAPCEIGMGCSTGVDCETGNCVTGTCACGGTHLLLSEIRTRGAGGGNDEFVEIYNPTSGPVLLDATWKIEVRSATTTTYAARWMGSGATVPAHGHYLVAGASYAGGVPADAALTSGISDASSVRLVQGASNIVDSVCLYYNAATLSSYQNDATFSCEGTPMSNLPHNDSTSGQSNSDASVERKPGGALGSCTDLGDNATDWASIAPAAPQDVASPTTP